MHIKKISAVLLTALTIVSGVFVTESNAYNYQEGKASKEYNLTKTEKISQKEIDELAAKYGLSRETDPSAYENNDTESIVIESKEDLEEIFKATSQAAESIDNMDIKADINNADGLQKGRQSATFSKGLGITVGQWSSAKFNTYRGSIGKMRILPVKTN